MNEKLNKFKQEIKGKKVAVVGVGVSNIPAIKYLVSLGAIVTACDKNENIINDTELNKLNISFNLGEKYLDNLKSFDYIFRSPGVKPFLNEIEEAVNNGVKLTSEIELLINLCNCKVIAVTGSDGKTTTTTLIAKILEEDGYNVHLGGNIGIPLFSKLDSIKSTDIIVLELSSFQLMTLKENIDISVITNISENHLDYHRDYQEYINAKANIFLNNKNGVIVFNHDDIVTKEYLKLVNINNDIRYFSLKDKVDNGTYLNDKYITINFDDEIKLCDINKIKLIGMHNIANICTAISALYGLVKLESILNVITNFSGVEHRIELVRELNGVKWYNDSIASSPSRTIAGLTSFDTKVILIAGWTKLKLF